MTYGSRKIILNCDFWKCVFMEMEIYVFALI